MPPQFGPMEHVWNPFFFTAEIAYTFFVVILLFLVYAKTKDLFDLTKHKGIQYFRDAFLFFGLAYLARFILQAITFGITQLDTMISLRIIVPIIVLPLGYLSTLAIFYLAYSTIWKKFKVDYFALIAHCTAGIISVVAFFSRSPEVLSLVQLPIIIFILGITVYKHQKATQQKKKQSSTTLLYFLISLFWLVNLVLFTPGRFVPREFRFVLQIVSLGVFLVLYYKVTKWTK